MPERTALLAGATGMLGSALAGHLLDGEGTALRLLVRPGSLHDPVKRRSLDALVERGATLVDGDVSDPQSLQEATRGVDVVVSALQGGRSVIVDGQVALAEAAAANGVRRILPSDYAVDFFKVPSGDHAALDLRREADARIADLDIEQVNVLNGAFLDGIATPGAMVQVDDNEGTASFWGTGDEPFDATTVDDTARYAARAALDPEIGPGKFAVSAQRLTMKDLVRHAERVNGRTYTPVSTGSVEDLRAFFDAQRADGRGDQVVWAAYLLYMLGGQTGLDDVQNGRYADIEPVTLAQLAA